MSKVSQYSTHASSNIQFMKLLQLYIFLNLVLCNLLFAFWTFGCEPQYISEAKFKFYEGKMLLRLRSGGGHYTSFGIFVFSKEKNNWNTIGISTLSANDSFQYNSNTFKTKSFFMEENNSEVSIYEQQASTPNGSFKICRAGDTLKITDKNNGALICYVTLPPKTGQFTS